METKMSGLSREMIIHPGETLKEVLEERNMSQQELALRTGVSAKHISTVLSEEKNISVNFAKKLEYAFGIDAEFWIGLQALYDRQLLEFDELHSISKEEISIFNRLKEVFNYIVEKKFISKEKQMEQNILELRKYLNVSNLTAISYLVSFGAFKVHTNVKYDPYVLFAWQRICESLSEKVTTKELPREEQIKQLLEICPEIKKLNRLSQDKINKKLQEYFSLCGIAFIIAPTFKGAPVQGFIKTNSDNKTIICMTLSEKRPDSFWFTLFHEIGHFINGDAKQRFIDFESVENEREIKADLFAKKILGKSA